MHRRPERAHGASLQRKLLALLLPTLLLVAGGELWLTRREAQDAADAAYDRSLLGAIKALDANVSTASGGLSVELPYRLFEFFELTATGPVYFRVATADGAVEIGSPDLPAPPRPTRTGVPQFYEAPYFGESLRLGIYERALDRPIGPGNARALVIQVAESMRSREEFTRRLVWQAAARDGLVLAATALAVALLVALALRPVARLAAQVRARAADDLQPLAAAGLPADVAPLVDAVNQQLQRTQGLVERQRRFLDDASHQLRTALATLRTQLDVALREPDRRARDGTLQALSTQLDLATRGTNQLLALARSDTIALQPDDVDLAALVRAMAIELLPLARARGLDFGVDVPEAALPARGNPALLREAFGNLVHNAIRCTPTGGEVTLCAAADAYGQSLTVTDSGPGLPPELAGRIGERFLRGREGGSGLGLAIAQSIAQRHQGRLVVQARDDGRPGLRAALWWPRPATEGQAT
jgi:two-component system sensor histidine kinase TctE